MKATKRLTIFGWMSFGLLICSSSLCAAPMSTTFTYQGRLLDNNVAADGVYDIQFKLYDDPNVLVANQIGSTIDANDIDIIDGYFIADLNFGEDAFGGDARWLQIGVRPGEETSGYIALSSLQPISPAPHALYATGSDWNNLANIPDGFADGTDDVGGADADWTVSGNDMYSAISGNVGIGTDSPAGKLDIAATPGPDGNPVIDQESLGNYLYTFTGVHNIWQSFTPAVSGYLTQLGVFVGCYGDVDTNATLSIYAGEGTGGSLLASRSISIPADGYTNLRYFDLSIPPYLESGQTYTFNIYNSPIYTAFNLYYSNDNSYSGGRCSMSSNYDLQFRTYMEEIVDFSSLTVMPGGNVGIGTTSPTQKLEVAGTVKADTFIGDAGGLTGIGSIETDPQVGTNTTNYVPRWNGSALSQGTIYDNGNIGIGTTSPTAILDVNGTAHLATANIGTWANQQVSTNGYCWVGNILYQWGTGTSTSDDGQSFAFPISFPHQCFTVSATLPALIYGYPSNFSLDRINDYDGSISFTYLAIGY